MEIYGQNIDAFIKQFRSDPHTGLDDSTTASAKQQYGRNVLKAKSNPEQFKDSKNKTSGNIYLLLFLLILLKCSFRLIQMSE